MNNNYQHYLQSQRKPPKSKSSAPLIAFIFVLVIIILILSGAVVYFYENLIKEYRKDLGRYENEIEALSRQISDILDFADNYESDMQKLFAPADDSDDSEEVIASIGLDSIISETAAKVSPSVIGIKIAVPSQNSFWGSRATEASGSGIILTEDGYIVTNYHVVSYADTYSNTVITVLLSDESEYTAQYIGGDEINDLAIIKINANNLPYATLGSSDDAKVGDFVIAIGNPLGANLYGSVTLGIISGVNRKIEAENVAEKLIQTDAAINPGNSGGALLNLNGEVIGINTVKIARDNVEGIGFAIPIDYAKPLIDSIIQHGYVKDRPTLGVSGMDISSSTARIYNVPRGLYVEHIDKNSGAETAGIQEYDIITKIDGENIYALNDIAKIVRTHKVGDSVTVTLWRDGGYYDLFVVLSEQT